MPPDRRSSLRRRWRAPLTLVLLGAITASTTAAAQAALPIRALRVHVTPPVRLHLPPVTQRELGLAAESVARYGDETGRVRTQLDSSLSDAADQVDSDVVTIGRTARARAAVRTCVSEGLKSTAEDYGEALADYAATRTDRFPGVYTSIASASYICIASHTGAPAEVVEPAAEYLAGHMHEQFAGVTRTTSDATAQQRWLGLLAERVGGSDEDAAALPSQPPPASTSSGDSPAGVIAAVAGALALLAIGAGVLRSRRS